MILASRRQVRKDTVRHASSRRRIMVGGCASSGAPSTKEQTDKNRKRAWHRMQSGASTTVSTSVLVPGQDSLSSVYNQSGTIVSVDTSCLQLLWDVTNSPKCPVDDVPSEDLETE